MVNVNQWLRYAAYLAISLLTVRLISLGLYPFFDTTESRYGEIARLMFETGNWVTPQFDYGTPFWGKPPLHTWLSAASFSMLGVSEFSGRLPHFLSGCLVVALVYRFTSQVLDREKAIAAVMVLCSCLGFIVAIGMVMTDTVLLLSITLAMMSFWHHVSLQGILGQSIDSNKRYSDVFFAALALGMLAKGPVALVLIGIGIAVWSIGNRILFKVIASLFWRRGITIFLLLTLPWYLWAEIRTPGFLNYFIIGEHFYRFVEPGWSGDLYGSAHDQPKGMIWIFWLAAAFPWSFVLIFSLATQAQFKRTPTKAVKEHGKAAPRYFRSYLVSWLIAPMLLFTLAGNILPIYVMPGFAALSILIVIVVKSLRVQVFSALLSGSLVMLTLALVSLGLVSQSSESALLKQVELTTDKPLYYWQHRPFSAQFYSQGRAKLAADEASLKSIINAEQPFYLAVKAKDKEFQQRLPTDCRVIAESKKRVMYQCF